MNLEQYIYLIVFILWLPAVIHGSIALSGGVSFYDYVRQSLDCAEDLRDSGGRFVYQPRVSVIMPCCGVDDKLEQTVRALKRQNHDDFEIIFTFESEHDPAYATVQRWTRDWQIPKHSLVVAGRAERRAQKIHNLLAAVEVVSDDRDVLVFLDSDAIPHQDWLGYLIAPLKDDTVGAATGYRWYVANGGLAAGVRCAWNAATVSYLADERSNFCWGGSTAIRRDRFNSLNIARYWDRALSDDYQLTRAVRDAGLKIRFVPQALIVSSDRTTLLDFWNFARRQMIITRVCGRTIWRSGALLCSHFMAGGTAVAALAIVGLFGWFGSGTATVAAFAGWAVIMILAGGKAVLRQIALRRVLCPPDLTWRDFCWDVFGTLTFAGSLHLHLVFASLTTRRIVWRNTEYELISPDETRILHWNENT